jgi:dihydropteroate synthase
MLVMGILNVTPDSFADGGEHFDIKDAIAHAQLMLRDGADIIDIGGESTRPGAERVSEAEELHRIIPVIEALAPLGATISIDTMRASVARAAVKAGATIVNDVSGGKADPHMLATVAELKCQYILMHWRGHSANMAALTEYSDVVHDVIAEMQVQIDRALKAGIEHSLIAIDPGLGFSKNAEQNWEILNHLEEFKALGYPILIGHSRKRFLGGDSPNDREEATVALTKKLASEGIWAVRVHNVAANKKAVNS